MIEQFSQTENTNSELQKDFANSLESILIQSKKNTSDFFSKTLVPKILSKARAGDIAGIRPFLTLVYFNEKELADISELIKTYSELATETTPENPHSDTPKVAVETTASKKKKKIKKK
jgi:hypothetical protein